MPLVSIFSSMRSLSVSQTDSTAAPTMSTMSTIESTYRCVVTLWLHPAWAFSPGGFVVSRRIDRHLSAQYPLHSGAISGVFPPLIFSSATSQQFLFIFSSSSLSTFFSWAAVSMPAHRRKLGIGNKWFNPASMSRSMSTTFFIATAGPRGSGSTGRLLPWVRLVFGQSVGQSAYWMMSPRVARMLPPRVVCPKVSNPSGVLTMSLARATSDLSQSGR